MTVRRYKVMPTGRERDALLALARAIPPGWFNEHPVFRTAQIQRWADLPAPTDWPTECDTASDIPIVEFRREYVRHEEGDRFVALIADDKVVELRPIKARG